MVSYRPDGTLVLRPVTRKWVHGYHKITRVRMSNGKVLRSTANHTVLTSQGWRTVEALRVGDVLGQRDSMGVVDRIELEDEPVPVYNLYTAGEHTFIVDGVVVHNFTVLRVLRTCLHRLVFDPLATIFEIQKNPA